jgi:excisionase family DNA binding protein
MEQAPSWQAIFGIQPAPSATASPSAPVPAGDGQPVAREWPELMTIRETAEYLNIGHTTLYNWIRSGTFPIEPVIAGKKQVRIARRRLENWLATGTVVTVTGPEVPAAAVPTPSVPVPAMVWLR